MNLESHSRVNLLPSSLAQTKAPPWDSSPWATVESRVVVRVALECIPIRLTILHSTPANPLGGMPRSRLGVVSGLI